MLSVPIEHGRPQMARVLILWHNFLAEPALDGLHVFVGGLPEAEKGAQLLAVTTAAVTFQRIVEPSGRQHLEMFGYAVEGGQRDPFVVVRESAFQLEKLHQHDEVQSPLLCALI